MRTEHHIRLFRNGRNQALRIPRELGLDPDEAFIPKHGERLASRRSLLPLRFARGAAEAWRQLCTMYLRHFSRRTVLAMVAATMPSPAFAQPIPGTLAAMGIAVYFLPAVVGLLIAKKGKRQLFAGVSAAVYAVSLLAPLSFLFGGKTFYVRLFLPYLLILVAIYIRWHNLTTKNK